MGSILSQAGEKCYRGDEKSSRKVCVRGISYLSQSLQAPRFWVRPRKTPAPTHVVRSELNSIEEVRLLRR
jgi:hypothetical protein